MRSFACFSDIMFHQTHSSPNIPAARLVHALQTHTHAHTARTHANALRTHANACTRTPTHAHARTRTHAHAHALRTHSARTHTHTHTHTRQAVPEAHHAVAELNPFLRNVFQRYEKLGFE